MPNSAKSSNIFQPDVFPATFCFLMKENFQILYVVKQQIVEF